MDAYVGIDVSAATLDMALWQDGHWHHKHVNNQARGFAQLRQWLKQRRVGQVHACLEATGHYSDAVATFLAEEGHVVSVVNPARIRAYAESQLSRTKTDQVDARLIADFCRTQQPTPWTPPDPAWLDLQTMVRHLDHLKTMRQQEENRLQAGLPSATVRTTVEAHVAFLSAQIADLEQHIRDHIDQHPDLKRQRDLLTSIPGIGDTTAHQLLAEVPDFRSFTSPRQLVAFAGLSPRQHQSGSSIRKRPRLAKVGNARLRKALYMPALVAQRYNPLLAAFAHRLRAAGKPPMLVVAAVMRKLLHLAFGILKSGQPFDPSHLLRCSSVS